MLEIVAIVVQTFCLIGIALFLFFIASALEEIAKFLRHITIDIERINPQPPSIPHDTTFL